LNLINIHGDGDGIRAPVLLWVLAIR